MLLRAYAVLVFFGVAGHAQAPSKPLDCSVDEAVALRAAPSGVTRVSTHELRVRWQSGARVFRDVVTGDMGGVDYRYCGYDPAIGFHLLFKHDDNIFGGVLLAHATGRLLPAGQQVIFSPDRSRYFATVQPDGLDGEEWHIYSIRRGAIWTGVSNIRVKDRSHTYEYAIAELTNPRWSARGDLQATLTCTATPHSETVTLRPQTRGFAWLPTVACPRAP